MPAGSTGDQVLHTWQGIYVMALNTKGREVPTIFVDVVRPAFAVGSPLWAWICQIAWTGLWNSVVPVEIRCHVVQCRDPRHRVRAIHGATILVRPQSQEETL
jgi:hypothetical protein